MTKLSVNINKIALIRNSRKGDNPSLEFFSRKIIESGADGITVHPRPDQRHIRADDLSDLIIITKELGVRVYPISDNKICNNSVVIFRFFLINTFKNYLGF